MCRPLRWADAWNACRNALRSTYLSKTISTPTRDTLIDATEKIRDAAHDCGIEDLDWLDDAGQAGHANTFPIARAMAPIKLSTADTVRSLLAGRGHKEALK